MQTRPTITKVQVARPYDTKQTESENGIGLLVILVSFVIRQAGPEGTLRNKN
jgi:hypothetical protein